MDNDGHRGITMSTQQPIVFTSFTSPFGRSVRICLFERGIEHRVVPSTRGERQVPEHLARHPFAKIPVLDHDNFLVYETQAIIRYVADVFPGNPLTPSDPRITARMNQVIGIIDAYFFSQVSSPIAGERIFAKMTGGAPNEDKIKAHVPNAYTCCAAIDAILADQPYMAGDALSLADIMAGPHLAVFAGTPEGLTVLGQYPRLRRWLDMISELDSFQRTVSPF
jgi:glutathione S-transferase